MSVVSDAVFGAQRDDKPRAAPLFRLHEMSVFINCIDYSK